MLFVMPPLVTSGLVAVVVFDIVFGLVLVSGVAALSHRRGTTILASLVAALAIGTRLATFLTPSVAVARVAMWLALVSLLVLTVLTLAQVFRAGPITTHRILGSIAAYLLIGLTWMVAYQLVLTSLPEAFHFPETENRALALLYFSFVSLTTVGYGDITAVAPVARSLAAGEALVGQLFPAILIARLVSMEISGRERHRLGTEDASKK